MKILAISGSARKQSTNTALLRTMQRMAPSEFEFDVFDQLAELPFFSPDLEGDSTPEAVLRFIDVFSEADAIVIASPEYVRAIPGGLKNAIDWLASRFEVIGKPIALVHASHRGDDMLQSLRLVLSTVSDHFLDEVFLRIPLIGKSVKEVEEFLQAPEPRAEIRAFLSEYQLAVR